MPNIEFNGNSWIDNNNGPSLDAVNLFICYKLDRCSRDLDTYFTLGNCLFRSVELTKNADPDKFIYSGIGSDSRWEVLFSDESYGKHFIIFGADMSSSVHVDNNRKNILILGEGPTQMVDGTTLTAEAKYPFNFSDSK